MQWYEEEVQALERLRPLATNGARPPVFYGSSSIRLWTTLADDIRPDDGPGILNLGFGGSTLAACDYFFSRLVPPVHPASLLLYAGDNDLGDGRSADEVVAAFRSLAGKVSVSLGAIPFGFVSIKPSPARSGILNHIRRVNELVRKDIACQPKWYYVDVFTAMLNDSGQPRSDLFSDDGLHMNAEGYRLWTRLLQPFRNQIFTP